MFGIQLGHWMVFFQRWVYRRAGESRVVCRFEIHGVTGAGAPIDESPKSEAARHPACTSSPSTGRQHVEAVDVAVGEAGSLLSGI